MRTSEVGLTLELFNVEDILRAYEYWPHTNRLECVVSEAKVSREPQNPGVSKWVSN
jgi:hypothetical protein